MDSSGPPHARERLVTTADCPICGNPSARGLATCLPCAGIGADGLVFAMKPARGAHSVTPRLRSFLGHKGEAEDLELAARGHRAIAAVPLESAQTVTAGFEEMGIPVRITAARLSWARLPKPLVLALGAMTTAGLLAGWTSTPSFLLLTPVILILIVLLAQTRLKAPIVESNRDASLAGSTELGARTARTLGRLAPGPARDRLARISGLARLMDRRLEPLDDEEAQNNLRVLVESAGPVAEELARLDELDDLLEDPDLAGDPTGTAAARQVEAKKAQLSGALDSATRILERAAQGNADTLRGAAELPTLARAIESRIEAWDEVLATLGSS